MPVPEHCLSIFIVDKFSPNIGQNSGVLQGLLSPALCMYVAHLRRIGFIRGQHVKSKEFSGVMVLLILGFFQLTLKHLSEKAHAP